MGAIVTPRPSHGKAGRTALPWIAGAISLFVHAGVVAALVVTLEKAPTPLPMISIELTPRPPGTKSAKVGTSATTAAKAGKEAKPEKKPDLLQATDTTKRPPDTARLSPPTASNTPPETAPPKTVPTEAALRKTTPQKPAPSLAKYPTKVAPVTRATPKPKSSKPAPVEKPQAVPPARADKPVETPTRPRSKTAERKSDATKPTALKRPTQPPKKAETRKVEVKKDVIQRPKREVRKTRRPASKSKTVQTRTTRKRVPPTRTAPKQTGPGRTRQAAALPGRDKGRFTPPRYGTGGGVNRPPAYPHRARRLGWQGRVVLRVRVDARGRVETVRLRRSSGHDVLDRAALKAVRGWRFTPATLGPVPVAAWINIPIRFRLTSDS